MKFSALNPKITLISIPSPFPSPIAAAFPKLLATCCCCAPSTEKIPHNLQRIYFCLYSDQFESDCRADNLCVCGRGARKYLHLLAMQSHESYATCTTKNFGGIAPLTHERTNERTKTLKMNHANINMY